MLSKQLKKFIDYVNKNIKTKLFKQAYKEEIKHQYEVMTNILKKNKLYEGSRANKGYLTYLSKHVAAVILITPIIKQYLKDNFDIKNIKTNEKIHDRSKLTKYEYPQYRDYWYKNKKSKLYFLAYMHAWNHHIHTNPHHWQYWVLINDGQFTALPMPMGDVVEMIADWLSVNVALKAPIENSFTVWPDTVRIQFDDSTWELLSKYFGITKKIFKVRKIIKPFKSLENK